MSALHVLHVFVDDKRIFCSERRDLGRLILQETCNRKIKITPEYQWSVIVYYFQLQKTKMLFEHRLRQ